ncbi:tripartite tricarboxylate transporter TctB family protein [Acuticoccus sp. I52.16.1]|uniref:tripartite tricarboxylate transporter TctB family protein n=1 Tax=Acuticoccus sp. I52.16.1 TaxID=2928472 RepID=UPI001FD0172A|nr:tripartite tricarboxylate transporter TctB family protein [Acuticoccus sp. I52.16.1]UOM35680.1 hypothetical protein MRB58_05600 [Acuticoccus sp. I52.16.1]
MTDPQPAPGVATTVDARALSRLRKADVWTGIVLAAVAVAMIAQALTFPLEGTYAGVKNAWYVSPALFPLMIGALMLVLSIGLLVRALRDFRALRPGGRLFSVEAGALGAEGRNALLIAAILAFYILGLVPRVDFVIATTALLTVFVGAYVIEAPVGRAVLVVLLGAAGVAAFAVALAGGWPAPRSAGQEVADAIVAAVAVLAMIALCVFARGAERRRLGPVIGTAIGTSIVLSAIFKYGLLVPLPREGLGVAVMDAVAGALAGLAG